MVQPSNTITTAQFAAKFKSKREIYLCQRSNGKPGKKLGKTTGWIHRTSLKRAGVKHVTGCTYLRVDDQGLHVSVDGQPRLLEVDTVVVCAGQLSRRDLLAPLTDAGISVQVIGGADKASGLDAKRAIDQGTRVAAAL